MRIPTKSQSYQCAFPDFDAGPITVEATYPRQAAEKAAHLWEREIEDFRILRGEDTLRIVVTGQGDGTVHRMEVLGVRGRYVAQIMPEGECE
jgi:hypothetical protein